MHVYVAVKLLESKKPSTDGCMSVVLVAHDGLLLAHDGNPTIQSNLVSDYTLLPVTVML